MGHATSPAVPPIQTQESRRLGAHLRGVALQLRLAVGRGLRGAAAFGGGPWRGSVTVFQEAGPRKMKCLIVLGGGLEHFLFFHILGVIIPID